MDTTAQLTWCGSHDLPRTRRLSRDALPLRAYGEPAPRRRDAPAAGDAYVAQRAVGGATVTNTPASKPEKWRWQPVNAESGGGSMSFWHLHFVQPRIINFTRNDITYRICGCKRPL